MSNTAIKSQLWAKVQRAYAKSRCYRAGDDPAFAKALAEYARVADAKPAGNVIPFPSGVINGRRGAA